MNKLEDFSFVTKIALGLIAFQAFYFGIVRWILFPESGTSMNPGTFGDSFGGLNATFTGLAFLGLLHSIAIQRKEMTKTEQANERLQKVEAKRDFETTFFQLLKLFTDIRGDLAARDSRLFGDLWDMLKMRVVLDYPNLIAKHKFLSENRTSTLTEVLTSELQRAAIRAECSHVFKEKNSLLGHYFRSLYYILRQINLSGLDESDRHLYADILRAQLTSEELIVIFFNGISPQGRKLRNLINQFGTLKHLDIKEAVHPELEKFYKFSAYERDRSLLEFYRERKRQSRLSPRIIPH